VFQWDAVDTSPDLGGHNVLETFEMAIRRNRRTTRSEFERVFCPWINFHLRLRGFSVRIRGLKTFLVQGGGDHPIAFPYGRIYIRRLFAMLTKARLIRQQRYRTTSRLRPATPTHFLPCDNAIYGMSPELNYVDKANKNCLPWQLQFDHLVLPTLLI